MTNLLWFIVGAAWGPIITNEFIAGEITNGDLVMVSLAAAFVLVAMRTAAE